MIPFLLNPWAWRQLWSLLSSALPYREHQHHQRASQSSQHAVEHPLHCDASLHLSIVFTTIKKHKCSNRSMGWVVLSSKVQSLAIKMIGCLCTSFLLRRLPMREIIIMRNCSLARRSLVSIFLMADCKSLVLVTDITTITHNNQQCITAETAMERYGTMVSLSWLLSWVNEYTLV